VTVFVSSGAFRFDTLTGVIEDALRLGITHLELSSNLAHDPEVEASIEMGLSQGLTLLLHNYFPAPSQPKVLNLAAPSDSDLAWSIAHCKRALDLAAMAGCPFYSLHAGYAVPLTADLLGDPAAQAEAMKDFMIDRKAAYGRMLNAVQDVADYAASLGKRLLIENNVIAPVYLREVSDNPLLMTDAEEIEKFMRDVGRSNVAFLIDVAHARVSATALAFDASEFMRRTEPFTEALHLSDNDSQEDQNLPFDDNSWFWPLLDMYADRPKVIESYKLRDNDLLRQIALLRNPTA